jgi:hypothetical protein
VGDHFLMVPFQCKLCHFRNILKRDPEENKARGVGILDTMKHANLDAFWKHKTYMVGSKLGEGRRMEKMMLPLGLQSVTP